MNLPSIREVKVHTHKSGLKWIKIAKNGIKKDFYAHTTAEVRKKYGIFKQQLQEKTTERITFTFLEWYEKWIQLYKSNIKENTLKNIKSIFQKYFLPKLAKKPLRRISSQDLQPIFNTMYKLVPRQCTVAYIQIKSCFEQA